MSRMTARSTVFSSLAVVAATLTCSGGAGESGPSTSRTTYELGLARVGSCSEVLDLVRAKVRSKMNAAIAGRR